MAAEVWTTVGLEMRMRCSVRPITVLSLMAGGGFYESVAAARAGETLLLLPVLRRVRATAWAVIRPRWDMFECWMRWGGGKAAAEE